LKKFVFDRQHTWFVLMKIMANYFYSFVDFTILA